MHSHWWIKKPRVMTQETRSVSASSRDGNFVQMERKFPFQAAGKGKVEYLRGPSVCSGKFPFDPRILFAFQPVEREILAK